ncbi:hypothetical protein MUP77_13925 [Candidatus Bathyarchaeota archaeon]|nr:hypothetical protein [Candidatus Bathyarchaeota archaeon]
MKKGVSVIRIANWLFKVILTVAVLLLGGLVLAHVYLLGVGVYTDQFCMFWLPIVVMGFVVFYSALHFRSRFPLILIMLLALTLHLIQFVRQPSGMAWDQASIYGLQLVNHVISTGHWTFGYGTGAAFGYSFYPMLYVFESIFSTVSSISSMTCSKFSMAFINLLTLLTFYVLVGGLFKLESRTKNLMVFIFVLNPLFHGEDSYTFTESFAIILFPLALLYVLKEKDSNRSIAGGVVAILLLLAITMSHAFTSYLVALSLVIPLSIIYLTSREFIGRKYLHILVIILPLAWLSFVAAWIFNEHANWILDIWRNLTSVQALVGYNYAPASSSIMYYPSGFSLQLALLRNFLLVAFPLIGLFWFSGIDNKKAYKHFKFLLLFFLATTVLLLYFVDWKQISAADIRDRIVAFSYFPIAFFFPLGIEVLSSKTDKFRQNRFNGNLRLIWKDVLKPIIAMMFIVVFLVPTILNAFPRFMYDTTYHPITSTEFPVAAEYQHALGSWVRLYVNSSSTDIVFTGSASAEKYVIGYGRFQGTWSGQLNETELSTDLAHSVFYVLNTFNIQLPDSNGRIVDPSTVQFLNEKFSRLYDNGVIIQFDRPPQNSHST